MAFGIRRKSRIKQVFALVKQIEPVGLQVGESNNFSHQQIQKAIDDAIPGTIINIDSGVYLGNLIIDKPLLIKGSGINTILNGTVTLKDGAQGTIIKFLKFADNVTVDNLVKNINISDCWISSGKTISDNNINTNDNLYLLLEEV
jgi:nitrous oxidase accessory protein NosD